MMFRDPPGGAPDAAALARSVAAAYQDVAAEVDVTLELASGQLPEALRGALYRNGPGAMGLGAERYHHPFDGDGMIACFEFDGGAVRYRNRFVATRERAEEQAAGRRLYRCFGTQLPGGWRRNAGRLRFKNSANTSVIKHAGSLWALWEGGWPHRLDPDTLDTLERNNLGGALCNDRSAIDAALNPELPFSAHPRLDARTGHLYNFGIAHGVTPRLMLYTLDAGGHVVERDAVALDAVSFVHDFGLTERWRVFLLPPVSFDLARTLAGVVSAAAEQVSKNVQTVATGTEEMGASIKEIAKSVQDAAKVAATAVRAAETTNATISKLGDSSAEIGKVIKVITSIAQQTNLLALNATIEAARAGEAGKGFAVVANEVKELAKETAKATEYISQKIEAIQSETKMAVDAIAEIGTVINKISDYQNTIASAVEEQTATTNEISRNVTEAARGSTEIAQNITGVATSARSTSAGAHDTQKAAGELSRMAAELQSIVTLHGS